MTMTTRQATGTDAERWPDVARAPRPRLRAAVARTLVLRAVAPLPLRMTTPDGRCWGAGGPADPELRLARPETFFARLGAGGLIGFGEAYMAGDWDSDDLTGVLAVLAGRLSTLFPPSLQRLARLVLPRRSTRDDNTPAGSRRNIERHYDLSNELFSLFLDSSLSYSAPLFDEDPADTDEDLSAAQQRKIARLLTCAEVGEGTRLLEIGTGWGELAIRAAARGARVTTITLSAEQAALARQRVEEAGCTDRVEVRLQDYREVTGEFDAIVSVEMIEAVGANHWHEYFAALDRLLAPGGRVAIQAITMAHDRMLASRDSYTWILKYIFPGGQIPSLAAMRHEAHRVGLQVDSELAFGAHYAEALARWRAAFEDRATEVEELGFDETFRRTWSLYLAYSEAGFRSAYLDVVQLGLSRV
jgi:cyclopropane-fatty-acyl-phospholipid synthase